MLRLMGLVMRTEAKPGKRDGDSADHAWGALVLAWFLAAFGAIVGWFASVLRYMFRDDD